MIQLMTPEEKQTAVQQAISRIQAGEVLSVVDASGCAYDICIGDFRRVGWSERCADRRGLWYEWRGPAAIIVGGQRVEPGGCTEYTEMDWS
jgi:hypothetical protein